MEHGSLQKNCKQKWTRKYKPKYIFYSLLSKEKENRKTLRVTEIYKTDKYNEKIAKRYCKLKKKKIEKKDRIKVGKKKRKANEK